MSRRNVFSFHALRELGSPSLAQYALYQLGLRSGLWRILTPPEHPVISPSPHVQFPLILPSGDQLVHILGDESQTLIEEADEICRGNVHLFGGPPAQLILKPEGKLHHWTAYERGLVPLDVEDIKVSWEVGRFEWAYTLARAYLLTASESYARTFWAYCEEFLRFNPPNMGIQWISAQEVALRLVALLFAAHVFADSPASTHERQEMIVASAVVHARRIIPTISYARAQNNNHLLSEAMGLFLGGISLKSFKESPKWRNTGWQLFNLGLQSQIDTDGIYIQHSTNYHRLMLQEALLVYSIARNTGLMFSQTILERLAAATRWLFSQMDPANGHVPNLGHNDGAYILPLAPGGISDYRPVAQAAARAFLGKPCLMPGPWDEFSLWLGLPLEKTPPNSSPAICPTVNRIDIGDGWATLRAVRFTTRPAHADQLHVDLWWMGQNIALDAGTYSYNMPPPWDNSLMSTLVHNTVTIDGKDQMQRAGRFLWLKRAQARLVDCREPDAVSAEHDGYRDLGINHRRTLKVLNDNEWEVVDEITSTRHNPTHRVAIQWLLPDLPWEIDKHTIALAGTYGRIILKIIATGSQTSSHISGNIQLVRAGEVIFGKEKICSPILGWYSPTYLVRLPALSMNMIYKTVLPLTIHSKWLLSGTGV